MFDMTYAEAIAKAAPLIEIGQKPAPASRSFCQVAQRNGEPAYETLKAAGHSPAKAAEIALDVKRGDPWAVQWLATLREGAAA